MKTNIRISSSIGDAVVAAFDEAIERSNDPQEVSRLASETVNRLLRRGRLNSRAPRRLRSPGLWSCGTSRRPGDPIPAE